MIPLSYLESKIYPNHLKNHVGNLQHEITASTLNNTLKKRENLSFTWYDKEGKIRGYILAYQGKMEDGTPGIYISDFSIEEGFRLQAIKPMIDTLTSTIKEHYPNLPIFAKMRTKTSYPLLKKLSERNNYIIATDEITSIGGEEFHQVVMKPKR